MATTAILEEQTFTGFSDGNLIELDSPAPLTAGEIYSVSWDGESYTLSAYASQINFGAIAIGNQALDEWIGGGAEGEHPALTEPFLIIYGPASLTGSVDLWAIQCVGDGCSSDEHIVAVYLGADEELPDYGPNDVSIKRYSGEGQIYENVPFIYLTHASGEGKVPFSYGMAVENVPIELDLADGDQTVVADDGILVKSAVIAKPADLSPENVRYGKEIAGVTGEFLGDTEEVTVDLAMADGNQIITPSAEGKSISKVTITKPETLIPANIASGVEIGGIIGTHEGGGGESVDLLAEESLKYFAYKIDMANKIIILSALSYRRLYADTGGYEVTIPDEIAGYSVVIDSDFM